MSEPKRRAREPAGLSTRSRLGSLMFLAYMFWRRQLRRLIRGRRDDGGARRFLENYANEGMRPLTAVQERLLEGAGRCIQCGLCSVICPAPVDRWLAYSRTLDRAEAAAQALSLGPTSNCGAGCTACAQICPTGVPVAAIPGLIARHQTVTSEASTR